MKRLHDHVGLATNDLEKSVDFYTNILGFEKFGECVASDGTPVVFLKNGELKYEIFAPVGGVPPEVACTVNHMSYLSDDIEADYEWFMSRGYECTTNGIEGLDAAWDNGCRYFKIKGPGGEEVEFDQIL